MRRWTAQYTSPPSLDDTGETRRFIGEIPCVDGPVGYTGEIPCADGPVNDTRRDSLCRWTGEPYSTLGI